MNTIVPDYYFDFKCAMNRCRHTCCAGWEIDIDEDSLEFYSGLPKKVREDLFCGIDQNTEPPSFRMQNNGRCFFLDDTGLCKLILKYGEDILCDICADHPRFRNYFGNTEEIGLGLCCEAAGRLILLRDSPMKLVTLEDDGENEPEAPDNWEAITQVADIRAELMRIAQNRALPICKRVEEIGRSFGFDPGFSAAEFAQYMLTLERMDERWADLLQLPVSVGLNEEQTAAFCSEYEICFEQLLVYLLFRHIPAALDDGDLPGHVVFCIAMWKVIAMLCAADSVSESRADRTDRIVDICRLFSSEIEYSDENPQKIISRLKAGT